MNTFLRLLCTKPFTKKKMRVYRPCMYSVHPSAIVNISRILRFNEQWDAERIMHNKVVGSLFIADGGSLTVGSFVVRPGCRITVNSNASLILGSGSINYDTVIECFNSITIGNDVVISERVMMRDSDNHTIMEAGEASVVSAPIVIQDNVWIGMGATILKGVTIGEGSVVAAGSVVTKDIPAHCLAAGVPAKVVKARISWERKPNRLSQE